MNKKIIVIGFLLVGFFLGYFYYHTNITVSQGTLHGMQDYLGSRDRDFIHKQFKDNYYFLTNSPAYDIDYMLTTKSPNKLEPEFFGKFIIKVLYDNNIPVGFTAYYMLTPQVGKIVFIDVDKDHRRKSYAKKMVAADLEDLKKRGAKVVKLVTRTDNIKAQGLYDGLGFTRMYVDDGHVHYKKEL